MELAFWVRHVHMSQWDMSTCGGGGDVMCRVAEISSHVDNRTCIVSLRHVHVSVRHVHVSQWDVSTVSVRHVLSPWDMSTCGSGGDVMCRVAEISSHVDSRTCIVSVRHVHMSQWDVSTCGGVAEISSHVDNRTCIVALSSKIVSLGRVYAASDNYFPLSTSPLHAYQFTHISVCMQTKWREVFFMYTMLYTVIDKHWYVSPVSIVSWFNWVECLFVAAL